MTGNVSIAQPYAKALFTLACEQQTLASWSQVLMWLGQLAKNLKWQRISKDPEISNKQLYQYLLQVFPESLLQDPLERQLRHFVQLLIDNKRLAVLPQIAAEFSQLKSQYENTIKVEVISAAVLDNSQRVALAKALQKRFNTQVMIDYQVNATLLGGVIIRSGRWVMDGSLRGKLQQLQDQLSSAW